jgi:hypothetical protein
LRKRYKELYKDVVEQQYQRFKSGGALPISARVPPIMPVSNINILTHLGPSVSTPAYNDAPLNRIPATNRTYSIYVRTVGVAVSQLSGLDPLEEDDNDIEEVSRGYVSTLEGQIVGKRRPAGNIARTRNVRTRRY